MLIKSSLFSLFLLWTKEGDIFWVFSLVLPIVELLLISIVWTLFDNLIFAFHVCRYVKSNAIVLASNKSTMGIGSGQPSRLDSCQIAINKMNKFFNEKNEVVAASDAFFPFVDGIEKLVQSGVSAVIQPAGSIRDKEIIKYANSTDTVLVFSKTRHFRH